MVEKNESRLVRRLSVSIAHDISLAINYLKIHSLKRTEQMLDYIRSILIRMKIMTDINPVFYENFLKKLAMYYKLLFKSKHEEISTDPCDIYILLSGEVTVSNDSRSFIIPEGGYFGEPSLHYPKISQYKLICSQSCIFGYLSYQQFLSISLHYSQFFLEQSAQLLRQIPIFKEIRHKKLLHLTSCFKTVSIDRHSSLFEEGEPCDHVFIIKTGEVELTKSVQFEQVKVVNYGKHGRPIYLPETKAKSKAKVGCLITSELEMIGDEEAANDLKWKYGCRCRSFVCVLFRISKIEFKKYLKTEECSDRWKEKDEVFNTRLQKSISIIMSNKRSSSLPLADKDVKRKVMKSLKLIDPWGMNRNLVISTRNCLSKDKLEEKEKLSTRDLGSCLNLYSNLKYKKCK